MRKINRKEGCRKNKRVVDEKCTSGISEIDAIGGFWMLIGSDLRPRRCFACDSADGGRADAFLKRRGGKRMLQERC